MDLVIKVVSIRKLFIKGRGAKVFRKIEKSVRPPYCENPLKFPRYLVQLLAIRILIANSCTRWRGILKGSQRMGEERIFTITSAPHAYQKNLISPVSIPLDRPLIFSSN